MHDPRVTCCRWDDFCVWTVLGVSLLGTILYVSLTDPLKGFAGPLRESGSGRPGVAETDPLRDGKPSQPITITAWFEKPFADVGAPGEIGIMVSPQIDAPTLEIELVLPDQVLRLDGPVSWTGAAAKGSRKGFFTKACCTEQGHHDIIARATIRYPNGAVFTANDVLTCALGECDEPSEKPRHDTVAPDGTRIREFPAAAPR